MPDIVLSNVNKRYPGTTEAAVRDLNLTIPDGSFTTFLGPSGCGKTTTLRMIAGLETPTGGEIAIGGQTVYSFEKGVSLAPSKRGLGLVFQSYALWPHLTVFENIAFGLQVKRLGRTQVAEAVRDVATALQIDEYLERYTSELSGGQQQRVAVARALAGHPDIVFADEPTGNLDSRSGAEILKFMRHAVDDLGQTIVMVTHDPAVAARADRVLELRDGRTVEGAGARGN